MRGGRTGATAALALAMVVGVAGCGDDSEKSGRTAPTPLTGSPRPGSPVPGSQAQAQSPAPVPAPAPAPGAADAPGVARFAGVSVPAVATVALARRSTNTAGLRVGRLVLVLQEGGLDPWCRAARLNGSFPQPRRPSAGDLERFGVSDLVADTAGSWRTCNGSHPGNNRVERDVLAHVAGDGVVTAHLLAYEMGR